MNRPYAHILSSKSTSLSRGTFIWADIFISVPLLVKFLSTLAIPQLLTVIQGFNSCLIPISSASLRRWMTEPDPNIRSEFSLGKVVMHPYGVMSYAIAFVDKSLSTEPLPAGDYR
ncbi:hypothetical protein ARMGADRAFT_1079574 [Armillaria gallica]|uniref:Uncharacterized protein n=1 Tax=Armillaria gallica TaxID=47427 RepID=A0A2H3DJT5_ARMGA|nr:hypothetical protein ARMGADRAFT_1079574 [Armillaria gallica]